jgi:hypothetical protein
MTWGKLAFRQQRRQEGYNHVINGTRILLTELSPREGYDTLRIRE